MSDTVQHPNSCRIDMRFLTVLGTENLAVKVAALILFNCFAFVEILLSRKQLLAVQYESIYSFPAALLAKIFCQCVTIGDDVLTPRESRWATAVAKALGSATDVMLCSTREMNVKWSGRTRALYVPSGIPERFLLKSRSINFERLKIMFVGAFSYRSNVLAVSHLMKASSGLHEEYKFVVVGSPVPRIASTRNVRFLGQLDDASLLRLYNDANVGVLPFFGIPAEGPKIKLLEYMAAQLLVISSPEGVQGYPELLACEHYVPAASVEELKQVLMNIQRSPERYGSIVKKAHDFVITNYRWPTLLVRYLNFVNSLREARV